MPTATTTVFLVCPGVHPGSPACPRSQDQSRWRPTLLLTSWERGPSYHLQTSTPTCSMSVSPTLLLAKAGHMAPSNLQGSQEGSSVTVMTWPSASMTITIPWPNQGSEAFLPLWLLWREMVTGSVVPTAKREAYCLEEQQCWVAKNRQLSRQQTSSATQGLNAFFMGNLKKTHPQLIFSHLLGSGVVFAFYLFLLVGTFFFFSTLRFVEILSRKY